MQISSSALLTALPKKAKKTDLKAAETDENIVLFTIQARFKVSQRSITTCSFRVVIMHFIVFNEILKTVLQVSMLTGGMTGLLTGC